MHSLLQRELSHSLPSVSGAQHRVHRRLGARQVVTPRRVGHDRLQPVFARRWRGGGAHGRGFVDILAAFFKLVYHSKRSIGLFWYTISDGGGQCWQGHTQARQQAVGLSRSVYHKHVRICFWLRAWQAAALARAVELGATGSRMGELGRGVSGAREHTSSRVSLAAWGPRLV